MICYREVYADLEEKGGRRRIVHGRVNKKGRRRRERESNSCCNDRPRRKREGRPEGGGNWRGVAGCIRRRERETAREGQSKRKGTRKGKLVDMPWRGGVGCKSKK
jgi:hypothetical protein